MGEVCPPSKTEGNILDVVIKALKLDKRAGGLYSETDKVFYLFIEDCRGVVKADPLQRRRSSRNSTKEIITYEIDESSIDEIKKLVFLPEKYVVKRAQQLLQS